MKISKSKIKNIIKEEVRNISESDEIYSSKSFAEDAKKIILASEYVSRKYSSIIHFKGSYSKFLLAISNLPKDVSLKRVGIILSSVNSENPDINLCKTIINQSLIFFSNISKKSTEILQIQDKNQQKNELMFLDEKIYNQFNLIKDLIKRSREIFNKISYDSSLKHMDSVISRDKISSQSIQMLSGFEKILNEYIESVEILMKKILGLKIKIEESDFPMENYSLFAANKLAKQYKIKFDELEAEARDIISGIPRRDKKFFDNEEYMKNVFKGKKIYPSTDVIDLMANMNSPLANPYEKTLKIDKDKLLNYIHGMVTNEIPSGLSYKEEHSVEYLMGKSIGKSILDTQQNEEKIDSFFQKTNVQKNEKILKNYFEIMQKIRELKNEYVLSFLNILEKDQSEFIDYLKNKSYILDVFIRFIQLQKVNIKKIFADFVTGKKSEKEIENLAKDYSERDRAKIDKRLRYWSLFQRLGWVSEEVPDWIYL